MYKRALLYEYGVQRECVLSSAYGPGESGWEALCQQSIGLRAGAARSRSGRRVQSGTRWGPCSVPEVILVGERNAW